MWLRQVALVAGDRDATVAALCDVLGIEVAFHDPGVKVFGLHNAVLPVGDTFLEVISPVTAEAPARRYRERSGGDSGYMVMLQTDAFDADRERMEALGIRLAWVGELPDIRGMHLHPRDTGGALLSLDEPRPAESWRWAGTDWQAHVSTARVRSLVGARITCADPGATAERWSAITREPIRREDGTPTLALARGRLAFVPGDPSRPDGVGAVELACVDGGAVLAAAAVRDLAPDATGFTLCGTRFELF